MTPFDPRDPDSVLDYIRPAAVVISREAIDSGFDRHRRLRQHPDFVDAFLDYSPTTLAGMRVNAMYRHVREMIDVLDPEGRYYAVRETQNRAAQELFIGGAVRIKFKFVRDRVSQVEVHEGDELEGLLDTTVVEPGMPSNIETQRVLQERRPGDLFGPQSVLPGVDAVQVLDDGRDRLCITARYDMDELQEQVARVQLAVYDQHEGQVWAVPLPEGTIEEIEAMSRPLADAVRVLRASRSA